MFDARLCNVVVMVVVNVKISRRSLTSPSAYVFYWGTIIVSVVHIHTSDSDGHDAPHAWIGSVHESLLPYHGKGIRAHATEAQLGKLCEWYETVTH